MGDKYWIIKSSLIEPQSKIIANDYLSLLKFRNLSYHTIVSYRWVLEMFLTHTYKPLDELEPDDILSWLKTQNDKSRKTVNLYLTILSCFFQFCYTEEYINRQLIKKRWYPKIPESIPKYLDNHEQARLKLASETMSIKKRAIVEFLLSSGCRRSELTALNIEDVDLENCTAKVIGKRKKIREVHFSIEASLLIKEYLKERQSDNNALFVTRTGNRIHNCEVYRITTDLGKKAGLKYSLNPHRYRHTFASNMLARGGEIEFISDELGHVDLNTTLIYTKIPGQDIIDEYNKKMGGI